nr:unnamed protein product [Callosobruchus analis]
MFKLHFVIATCIVAVVVAIPPPRSSVLEGAHKTTIKILESIESEGKSIKDVKKVKTILKSLLESIKHQADSSFGRASEDTENVTSKAEDVSDIIDKMNMCWKQNVDDKSKISLDAMAEMFLKACEDFLKLQQCQVSKDQKQCIETTTRLLKQDATDLLNKVEGQIQWMLNDALPDFYSCVLKK